MMLIDFLRTGRGIAFSQMFAMKEYPHDVMPLYSQGYSLARYLVAQGGKRKFLDYLADGMRDENWTRATQKHYGVNSLAALQNTLARLGPQGQPGAGCDTRDAGRWWPSTASAIAERPRPSAESSTARPSPTERAAADASRPRPTPTRRASTSWPRLAGKLKSAAAADERADKSWRSPRRSAERAAPRQRSPRRSDRPTTPTRPAGQSQHQVTRPQPVQRPRQVILEWSQPPGNEPSVAAVTAGE